MTSMERYASNGQLVSKGTRVIKAMQSTWMTPRVFAVCVDPDADVWRAEVFLHGHLLLSTDPRPGENEAAEEASRLIAERFAALLSSGGRP
jgi:hypothetical protein